MMIEYNERTNYKYFEYPENLLHDVLNVNGNRADCVRKALSVPDILGTVEYLLHTLTEREMRLVKERYIGRKTLMDMGNAEMITRERIRQVIAKALRKLRNPIRANKLMYGVEGYYKMKLCELENRKNEEIEMIRGIKPRCREEFPIEELDFSVRAYNCLRRAGCYTVEDILKLTPKEFIRIRNLGRKSAEEIIYKLSDLGVDMTEFRIALNIAKEGAE